MLETQGFYPRIASHRIFSRRLRKSIWDGENWDAARRLGSPNLFLFLASVSTSTFEGGPENLCTDSRNTNDGATTFLGICLRTRSFTHSWRRARASMADGVDPRSPAHENSFGKSYLRVASVRTSLTHIYYMRLAPIPSAPRTTSGLRPISLCLRHKPSPRSSVIRLLSSTTTWHSTPSDLWIPSYRAARPAALHEFRNVYEAREINFGSQENSRVPPWANSERSERLWHIY